MLKICKRFEILLLVYFHFQDLRHIHMWYSVVLRFIFTWNCCGNSGQEVDRGVQEVAREAGSECGKKKWEAQTDLQQQCRQKPPHTKTLSQDTSHFLKISRKQGGTDNEEKGRKTSNTATHTLSCLQPK